MKKLLPIGTAVLLMATSASAPSSGPGGYGSAFGGGFGSGGGTGFGVTPRITVPCRPSNAWYAPHPYYPEKPCSQQTKMKRNK